MISRFLYRLLNDAEYTIVIGVGHLLGISWVVRYLRNPNPQITVRVLRAFGAKIGLKTTFKRSLFIDNAYEDQNSTGDFQNLEVGSNCYIGDCVYLDLADRIILENDVIVSGQVAFITHADCNRSSCLQEIFPRKCAPIRVRNGAWLGFGTTLQAGITIGACAAVGSGSLLREDAEASMLYAGIPAKKIRALVTPGEGRDTEEKT